MKIIHIAGARPNFMKVAPLMKAFEDLNRTSRPHVQQKLIHTGQHYDSGMSRIFLKELGIGKPHIHLRVGSHSHTIQVAKIMSALERILKRERPDLVIVVGDVNSTLAASVVAAQLGIKLVHVEAGLRSYDRTMPEEINRILTDTLSDYLFTSCREASRNLVKEGVAPNKIFFVGNIMIDSLIHNLKKAERSGIRNRLRLTPKGYALLTLHRPSNVDQAHSLGVILDAIAVIQKKIKVVFPVHPRTRKRLEASPSLKRKLNAMPNLLLLDPLGYLDFLALEKDAGLCLTDSGGIQEETTYLGVPCITLRENTERPSTVSEGTNVLSGIHAGKIIRHARAAIDGRWKKGRTPELWDGCTAIRIAKKIRSLFAGQ